MCQDGRIAETKAITVRSVAGEKFDTIIGYQLGDVPAPIDPNERDDGDLPAYHWVPDSEVPF